MKIPCSPWPCSRRIWRCGGRYPSPCDLRTPPRPPTRVFVQTAPGWWRSATSNDKGEETVAQPRTTSIAAGAATHRTQASPEQPQARQPTGRRPPNNRNGPGACRAREGYALAKALFDLPGEQAGEGVQVVAPTALRALGEGQRLGERLQRDIATLAGSAALDLDLALGQTALAR